MKTKNILLYTFLVTVLMTYSGDVLSQLNTLGGYLMGNSIEIGINQMGHEGTSAPSFTNHSRSNQINPNYFFGFVANPQLNSWASYDGDFFTPGSPENGFGIEYNGVNYMNNAYVFSNTITSSSLSNYQVSGNCKSIEWNGFIGGLQVKLVYKLNVTKLFYTTDVTLTNATGATINDLYFYRNLDPDNNVSINSDYATQNSIVSQPSPTCPLSLVSAKQFIPSQSYIGLAALDANCRVSYGGFFNRDGSDIWNAIGFVGTVGSVLTADQAISLAYKIPTFLNGETKKFSFAVILDESSLGAAFSSLFQLNFPGSTINDVCEPVADTTRIVCGTTPINISISGPETSSYDWTWSPVIGLSSLTGSSINILPNTNMTYTVTGTPISCMNFSITKQLVVSCLSTLPVGLVNFEAEPDFDNRTVKLKWITETETSNDYFEIQRSFNFQEWETIGIKDGSGTSTSLVNYHFTDLNPSFFKNYYRLKQVDFNGQTRFSDVQIASFDSYGDNWIAFPNPTDGIITLSGENMDKYS
ncbi:MAG: hypothetical protein ACK476_16470, partial [Fluviicola sp.]